MMLSKALNLIAFQNAKLIYFFSPKIHNFMLSQLMWGAVVCTVSYDKSTSFCVSFTQVGVIQDVSDSVVTVAAYALLTLFRICPAVCAAHVNHLSRHFILNIRSSLQWGNFNISFFWHSTSFIQYGNLECRMRRSKMADIALITDVKSQVKWVY